ncbi:MAG: hypothetical protein ACR2PL_05690 [Dehalococcoidia bacterium]
MASEPQKLTIPPDSELARRIKEADRGTARFLIDTGEATYELSVRPLAGRRARRSHRAPSTTLPVAEDDPLFRLIGIGASNTSGDISENKTTYLAKAKRDLSS